MAVARPPEGAGHRASAHRALETPVPLPLRRLVALGLALAIVLGAGAVLSGRVAYYVTQGTSMNPVYHAGDFVLVARSGTYDVGDIVAYPTPSLVVLHRIIGGDATGFETQGDNNASVDPGRPSADDITGRAILHVPKVGAALTSPLTRAVLAAAVITLLGALAVKPSTSRAAHAHRARARSAGADSAHASAARAAAPGAVHEPTRTAWVGLVALDLLLLTALLLTFALAPSPIGPAPAATQTATLGYHADTPPSETYPMGAVATGDAVFRKLVDAVTVSFGYTTDAPAGSVEGTARLDAALSTADGWRTTLPLVAPTPLVAGAADIEGRLDLVAIDELAARVAAETGFPAGRVDVVVTATAEASVHGAPPAPFSQELALSLTPLALTHAGAAPTDTSMGPALTATEPLGPTAQDVGGESGWASQQVRMGLLAALLLAVAGTAMLWPTADTSATASGEGLRRRAANIQLPPTAALVELADRAELEQLARRLDRPILVGADGWEGTLADGTWYWARTGPGSAGPVPSAAPGSVPPGATAIAFDRAA